jgi:hypothetical protein
MTCIALCACGRPNMAAARKRRCARFWRPWSSRRSACVWVKPLAAIGRKIGLTNEDFAVFESVRDKTPAKPLSFD